MQFSSIYCLDCSASPSSPVNTLESVREYAQALLASFPVPKLSDKFGSGLSSSPPLSEPPLSLPPAGVGSPPNGTHATTTTGVQDEMDKNGKRRAIYPPEELRRMESERERVDEGGLTGCREAVEILTRNPRKGSFMRVFTYWMILCADALVFFFLPFLILFISII